MGLGSQRGTTIQDARVRSDRQDSEYEKMKWQQKMSLYQAIGSFALPFLLPMALPAVFGTAAGAGGAAASGTAAKAAWFPKLNQAASGWSWAKTPWGRGMIKSLTAGVGAGIGGLIAGKPPKGQFGTTPQKGYGMQNALGLMGSQFMNEWMTSREQQRLDNLKRSDIINRSGEDLMSRVGMTLVGPNPADEFLNRHYSNKSVNTMDFKGLFQDDYMGITQRRPEVWWSR